MLTDHSITVRTIFGANSVSDDSPASLGNWMSQILSNETFKCFDPVFWREIMERHDLMIKASPTHSRRKWQGLFASPIA